jgi:hypothetical protein
MILAMVTAPIMDESVNIASSLAELAPRSRLRLAMISISSRNP